MAKAKRRGRPPGSKNKKSIGKAVATMDIAQLRAHIEYLQNTLSKKVSEQRAYFEEQLPTRRLRLEEGDGRCEGSHAERQSRQAGKGQGEVPKQKR
jgi:hypothetical protein